MAVATGRDAYIGGQWVPGDGEEIERSEAPPRTGSPAR